MDQSQSNQTEMMRSFQLKKEQIAAFYNQHRLIASVGNLTNQLNENLINQNQLAIGNQQLNHQLHLDKSLNSKIRLSPNQLKPIILTNEIENENLKNYHLNQLNSSNHLNHLNNKFKNENMNKFKYSTLNDTQQQQQQQQQRQQQQQQQIKSPSIQPSAFKPVVRRKDSVYSMDFCIDNKRLAYDQQLINLIKRTNEFNEQSTTTKDQRIKSPKKSFNLARKSPTNHRPFTPTHHVFIRSTNTI